MEFHSILLAVFIFQVIAVLILLHLIKVTGRKRAWITLAVALSLLAVNSLFFLKEIAPQSGVTISPSLKAFILVAHLLFIAGLMLIVPVFRAIQQSESRAKKSEERFELAVRGSMDGLWDWELESNHVWYAPRYKELLGYSEDEFPNALTSMNDHLHPEDYAMVWDAINAHLYQKTPFDVEFRLRRKNGDYGWFRARGQAVWDEEGRPKRMAGSIRDITSRKRQKILLNQLQHLSKIGGWEYDVIREELKWTDEVYRIHEIPLGTPVNVDMAIQFYHSDSVKTIRHVFQRAVETGVGWDLELKLVTQKDRTIDVRAIGKTYKENGRVVRVAGTFQDISEQKRANKILQLTQHSIDHSQNPIFWIEPNGKFCYVNKAACRVLGYAEHELLELSVYDIDPIWDKDYWDREGYVKIKANRSMRFESKAITKSGEVFPVEVMVNYIQFDGKEYLFSMINDIRLRKKAESKLKASQEQFSSFMAHLPGLAHIKDDQHRLLYLNEAFENVFSIRREDWLGKTVREVLPEDTADAIIQNDRWVLSNKKSLEIIEKCEMPDGIRHYLSYKFPILRDGQMPLVGGISIDITDMKKYQDELRKLSSAVDQSSSSVIIMDIDERIDYANAKFCELSEYTREEVIGQNARPFVFGNMMEPQMIKIWETVCSGQEWRGEVRKRRKSGGQYWENVSITPIMSKTGTITHFLAVNEDITLRREYEAQLLKKANYDELTDLPNRFLGIDRLTQEMKRAERLQRHVAVLFVDLDHFKYVNDTLGHSLGDELLVKATERLKNCIRDCDTLARWGGDEFLIIISDLTDVADSKKIAQKVIDAFSDSFKLNGSEVFVSASIGISLFPVDGASADMLLRNADIAMYRAKDDMRNTFRYFTREMNEHIVKRLSMEAQLRYALAKNEFSLAFQPIFGMHSRDLVGLEALIRWKNSALGQVPPNQFIPLAEDNGMINVIGDWVVERACEAVKNYQQQTGRQLFVSVNISYRQLIGNNLMKVIRRALSANKLAPESLVLEVTERLLIEDFAKTKTLLEKFRKLGVQVGLDDFGTGYASLSYLKQFPFNIVKLDQSFIRDVPGNKEDGAMIRGIIHMAHNLGLTVIGEGVETQKQLKFLVREKCDFIQGYYFSKPLFTKECEFFMKRIIDQHQRAML